MKYHGHVDPLCFSISIFMKHFKPVDNTFLSVDYLDRLYLLYIGISCEYAKFDDIQIKAFLGAG